VRPTSRRQAFGSPPVAHRWPRYSRGAISHAARSPRAAPQAVPVLPRSLVLGRTESRPPRSRRRRRTRRVRPCPGRPPGCSSSARAARRVRGPTPRRRAGHRPGGGALELAQANNARATQCSSHARRHSWASLTASTPARNTRSCHSRSRALLRTSISTTSATRRYVALKVARSMALRPATSRREHLQGSRPSCPSTTAGGSD
jgi:hypothetical protein